MKKITLIFLLLAAPLFLRAQELTTHFPYWTISKDIHRFPYRTSHYVPSTLQLTDVSSLVSKNIHRKRNSYTGQVAQSGYPIWTISKPVARQAAQRSSKKRTGKE